jgi:phosphate starvation-inducible PhoH-like protein
MKHGQFKQERKAHHGRPQEFEREEKIKVDRSPIRPKNEVQSNYIHAIKTSPITIGEGPAGTGKTWIAAALAAEALESKQIDKLILTRPAIEAGEKLGYLPGEIDDKFDPFMRPFRDALNERLGSSFVDLLIKTGRIECAPLAYMRGRTFKSTWIILDEAQNTTPKQMKMFLTRVGENCKVLVNGDVTQMDITGESGLADAIKRLKKLKSVAVVSFEGSDVVRSGIAQEIVEAYEVAH